MRSFQPLFLWNSTLPSGYNPCFVQKECWFPTHNWIYQSIKREYQQNLNFLFYSSITSSILELQDSSDQATGAIYDVGVPGRPYPTILCPAPRRSSPDLTTYLCTTTRSSNKPFLWSVIYVRYPLVPDSILRLFDGPWRATDHLLSGKQPNPMTYALRSAGLIDA